MRSESIPDDDQRLTMAELRNENIGVRSESGGERPSRWLSLLTSRFSLLTWWEAVGYGALVLIGLGMRLWELGARAMHHDESLHALYSWNLFNGSEYIHNPMMHGPFQFEANAALFLVFGDSDATARLLYAIMGTVLIAMPLLFRSRLGRVGALAVSALIFASPAILYFSRFARNDILMAVWTLGLVTCMWRYLDEGRERYLYISAGLLALAFATKESAYLVVGTLGLWCLLLALRQAQDERRDRPFGSSGEERGPSAAQERSERGPSAGSGLGLSPPVAIWRGLRALWYSDRNYQIDLANLSRPAAFVVFLIAVTLPQWSAFSAILQDTPLLSWTGLVLAAPEGSVRIGDPVGGGNVIAFLIVIGMIGFSAYLGYRWNWSVWWRCALIFYSIWTLLYTTFLTNFYGGVKSGIWQALGYWIVQQGEGRGGQPWYYYFVTMSVYEFLPFFVGIVGIVYFLRRRERFSAFLVYWPVTTFLLYTIASEKMPWLLVNITLPFIVITGMFLTDVARRIDWRKAMEHSGYLLVAGCAAVHRSAVEPGVLRSHGQHRYGRGDPGRSRGDVGGDGGVGGVHVALAGGREPGLHLPAGRLGDADSAVGQGWGYRVLPERRRSGGDDRLHADVSGRDSPAGVDSSQRARDEPGWRGADSYRRHFGVFVALGVVL